jgi:hypothetical protein
MNVLLLRWDTKPDKRIRRTFLRPASTRRTSFYAADRSVYQHDLWVLSQFVSNVRRAGEARSTAGLLRGRPGLVAEQTGEQMGLNSLVGLSRCLGSEVLANLRPPRLVLMREPDQLGVERADQPLTFGARLVELAEEDGRVAGDDDPAAARLDDDHL